MKLTDKAAYLKGLAEGMALDTAKPKNKLIVELLTLVGDMADKIDALEEELDTHAAYLDELDHDLGDLEAEVWEIDEDDEYDEDFDDEDFDDEDDEYEDDEEDDEFDEDDDDEVFYEVTCPNCGEKVYFDETVDPSDITCPSCSESFDCDFDEECCCGDCADCDDCDECEDADKDEE